ncbi:ABC transporter ATP-binding protein [Corynebacterium otitidis]|nr:ABC transporter ATP-binding protein [Corynebacterium otitidis]EJZ82354.1 hypothetical protein HMPREF9719_00725 [Corynebacterium otitidis ATCC 51513]
MIAVTRRRLSPAGRRAFNRALPLYVLAGVLEGLGLLALLPLAAAIAGESEPFGLGVGGWLAVIAALAVACLATTAAHTKTGYGAAMDFVRHGHLSLGDQIASLPLGWFHKGRAAQISTLVSSGFMSVGAVIAGTVSVVAVNAAGAATIYIGAWLWQPVLGLALTIGGPIAAGIMLLTQRIKRASDRRVVPTTRELSARILEFATCQPALRAAGQGADFAPLKAAHARNDAERRRDLWVSSGALALSAVAVQVVVVALMVAAAAAALDGRLTAIGAVAAIGLTLRFAQNLTNLGQMLVGVESARRPIDETDEILETPTLDEPAESAPITSPGEVELEHVSFGYEPGHRVLDDVSLTARPGEVLALVGLSGSGKTTVARLIARFWDADEGTVRVGGADVRELTTEDLMAQLSLVFQDVYLFDDTLWANIKVGRPGATDDEIARAAQLAGVAAIAERLPQGYDTRVGEGGSALSGGERQRVSVARALVKGAPVVLFDEATSALDAENEAAITAAVDRLSETSTFIVIAHKLETVAAADRIVVLDENGRVAETGSHEQLMDSGGAYRAFWRRRSEAAGWTLAEG